ncbi:NACHT domain-containing protein [Actinoplanes subglobosus]|uniref:NACHT domain-containing protein n=1 Tax=Actinoplanes subglobosus TaxID=1547892 RepID=A0ABV8J7A7_9ACTN
MTLLPGDPGYGYGSGYLVARDLVLTARHVLAGAMGIDVRFGTRPGRPVCGCSVVWEGASPGIDLALLKLHRPIDDQVEPVWFGDVDQIAGGRATFTAVGFPALKRQRIDDTVVRDTERLDGVIQAGSNAKSGMLDLLHRDRPGSRGADWQGMSGAAVFSREYLVGVVTQAESADTPLRATPVSRVLSERVALYGAESPTSRDLFRSVAAAAGLPAGFQPVRRGASYRATVRRLVQQLPVPPNFAANRAALLSFATTTSKPQYQWWVGDAGSGKTCLAAHLANQDHDNLDIVSFFFSRSSGQDLEQFWPAVSDQLAALIGRPAVLDAHPAEFHFLWERARQAAVRRSRHLLLIIDGIDESRRPNVLMANLPETGNHSHVLLLSRPLPLDANALPAGHPVRSRITCPQISLSSDGEARRSWLEAVVPAEPSPELGPALALHQRLDTFHGRLEGDPTHYLSGDRVVDHDRLSGYLDAVEELLGRERLGDLLAHLEGAVVRDSSNFWDALVPLPRGGPVEAEFQARLARRVHTALPAAAAAVPAADVIEQQAREAVAEQRFQDAEDLLRRAGELDAARAERLAGEFGFLGLTGDDRLVLTGLWAITAAPNDFSPLVPADRPPAAGGTSAGPSSARTVSRPAPTRAAGTTAPVREQRSGQRHSGSASPFVALQELMTLLFAPDQPARSLPRWDQPATLRTLHNDTVRCRVEATHQRDPVGLAAIATAVVTASFRQQTDAIDHWILLAPHADPDDDLSAMLSAWGTTGQYPFTVHVWGRARLARYLAATPSAYRELYDAEPPAELAGRPPGETVAELRAQLTPRLRIAGVWQRYLADPHAHCFVSEDPRDFDALYRGHLHLNVADAAGSRLPGTLDSKVDDWLDDRNAPSLLLFAEFGEGKSYFTYCLSRRLSDRFRDGRPGGYLPLRLPLREFRTAGSARALLQQRLAYLGATLADWRTLRAENRTLVVLDGFDEMSVNLSPATVTENMRALHQCFEEVGATKTLVTSRGRVLGRDQDRLVDRLDRPEIVTIAPVERSELLKYLENAVHDESSKRALERVRELYDPIGLAAKPLFLEMIRETLHDLPDGDLDERVLYDTYIRRSLRRKIDFLEDDDLLLLRDELIDNLLEVLEMVALKLQLANKPYVSLRQFTQVAEPRLAEMLWRMKDAPAGTAVSGSEDDATARVGVRSLLKVVPGADADQWPVDFFHRSMREYFVARAIARALRADQHKAREILRKLAPSPEITHFATAMLRAGETGPVRDVLAAFARSATLAVDERHLGGNALTLLYATGDGLPDTDWSGLRLDYASLPGADLSRARFAGASLRYANLDNANLEYADFTGADLEGVRLEETAQVLAVTALPGGRIAAAYGDRSVREWQPGPSGRFESRPVATLDFQPERLQSTAAGRLVAAGESMLSVLDRRTDGGWAEIARFRTKSRFRPIAFGPGAATYTEELAGGLSRLVRFRPSTLELLSFDDSPAVSGGPYAESGAAYAHATPHQVRVVMPGGTDAMVEEKNVSCLHLRPDGDRLLLVTGHYDGTVTLVQVEPDRPHLRPVQLWSRPLHEGMVTSVELADDRVLSGGVDRAISIVRLDAGPQDRPLLLRLTLRCRGVRFEGVRTDREQQRLRDSSTSDPTEGTCR